MSSEFGVGKRVAFLDPFDDVAGTVTAVVAVSDRQLLTMECDDGESYMILVDPAGRAGFNVLKVLPGRGAAETLAGQILAGREMKLPETYQVNILAAAVLAGSPEAKTADSQIVPEPPEPIQ